MVLNVLVLNKNSSKRNGPNWIKNLSFYFMEYCENTSIHGLKFLGERKRSVVEKLWWLIFLGTSLYFCIILIMKIYHKWDSSPVIVTFATSQTPIWKIPFPAVTICPEIKSRKGKYNFTEELIWYEKSRENAFNFEEELIRYVKSETSEYNFTEGQIWYKEKLNADRERATRYEYMSLVCPTMFDLSGMCNCSDTVNKTAIDFLLEVAPDFSDILFSCRWLGDEVMERVEKLFTTTLTSEGICYTFNMLDREDIFTNVTYIHNKIGLTIQDQSQWTVENGYDKDAELETFPKRTLLSGMKGGLNLILATNAKDIDPLCGDSIQGYKVILHHPAEIPKADEQYFRVPLNYDVVAAIKPNMMTTSKDLKHYDVEDRQCYFIKEKTLHFFKVYNQQNCLLECLSKFTYAYCNCVAFYMPRDNLTDVCGREMSWCLSMANSLFLAQEVSLKIKNSYKNTNTSNANFQKDCNCLPSCDSLEFETETSQSDWDWRAAVTLYKFPELNTTHYSRLRIFFKSMQFITSERHELYGPTDFWANCGGLLGLCTGFSFISLVEILYFLTLRFICNVKKFGLNYWSGAKELIENEDK